MTNMPTHQAKASFTLKLSIWKATNRTKLKKDPVYHVLGSINLMKVNFRERVHIEQHMRASKAKKFSMNKSMLILPIPISFTHKRNTIKSIRKIQSKLDKMCHVLADISLIEESLTERVPTTSLIKEGRESRQYLKISILTL